MSMPCRLNCMCWFNYYIRVSLKFPQLCDKAKPHFKMCAYISSLCSAEIYCLLPMAAKAF